MGARREGAKWEDTVYPVENNVNARRVHLINKVLLGLKITANMGQGDEPEEGKGRQKSGKTHSLVVSGQYLLSVPISASVDTSVLLTPNQIQKPKK
jgi:hypothetical protein